MVNYRHFSFRKINTDEYRHVWLLLFWPIFGILFGIAERFRITGTYHPVWSPVDDMIPFCEYFLPAYLFWFIFLTGMVLYTFFADVENFKKMMRFIIITYTITIIIYYIWPTCQNLRPLTFPRRNILTRFMKWFYAFDTNTNVCPSIHVLGSVAAMNAAWCTKRFSGIGWRVTNVIITVLICISTVFVKQHSIIDVLCALPLCLVAWYVVYILPSRRKTHSVN